MNILPEDKKIHILFLISVWIKGIAGLVETITGIISFFVTPEVLKSFVISLTAPELSEDPTDWIATNLRRSVQHITTDTTLFAAGYLIIHGLIKIFLVAGLLTRRLWSYPLSLWFLALFIIYQFYLYTHTHSLVLILITIFDIIVVYLIWREYVLQKRIAHNT